MVPFDAPLGLVDSGKLLTPGFEMGAWSCTGGTLDDCVRAGRAGRTGTLGLAGVAGGGGQECGREELRLEPNTWIIAQSQYLS